MEATQLLLQRLKARNTKLIVITGGVCSSLGKGVLISSIGVLLKTADYAISVMKLDPYLNIDPGTMSPSVHGEVFVTADGAETDLDLGHYERNFDMSLTRHSSVSAGQVYKEVLDGERQGKYLGHNIQIATHVVDVIKQRILRAALENPVDFFLIEIGGTVGDLEIEIFLESIRQLRDALASTHFLHGHLCYVPTLSWSGDIKTKPTQHSMNGLKRAGLVPDFLFLRTDQHIDQRSLHTLSLFCGLAQECMFQVLTHDPVFALFGDLDGQGLTHKIQTYFKIEQPRQAEIGTWQSYVQLIKASKEQIRIGVVVKYVSNSDPYLSVIDALKAAVYHAGRKLDLVEIAAEDLEEPIGSDRYQQAMSKLQSVVGIVVPGGFGRRGIEGKILATRFAREYKVPFLGLCLGMQVMVIEAARSLLGLSQANSLEFDELTPDPVVTLMAQQKGVTALGGTMRLGSYPCALVPGTKAHQAYGALQAVERHRHRFEVNNAYRERLAAVGLVFSGINTELDLVEITEIADHPFMAGSQFHAEFTSGPLKVNPLFKAFVQAACEYSVPVEPLLGVGLAGNGQAKQPANFF